MSVDQIKKMFRGKMLTWLKEQPRTDDEIADKFYEAVSIAYDVTREGTTSYNKMREMLWAELLRPPASQS